MQEIALICQDAIQSADDAVMALTAHHFIFKSPKRTEIELTGFNVTYTFVDQNSYITKRFDYVLKKGSPSTNTLTHWHSLITTAAPAPTALLSRSEIAYLGGITMFNPGSVQALYMGYTADDDSDLPYAYMYGYKTTDLTVKCECGVAIAMGKEGTPEMHSDWCPVYVKWLKEKK